MKASALKGYYPLKCKGFMHHFEVDAKPGDNCLCGKIFKVAELNLSRSEPMKPGDKFLVMFEVKRLAQPGQIVNGIATGPNSKQNLWIAEVDGAPDCKLLICSDGLPEMPPIPRNMYGVNFNT